MTPAAVSTARPSVPTPRQPPAGMVQDPPPVAVRARPGPVLAVIATGVVAILWLWWHDTPDVHGFGDWLTNAGRITGLLAGYAVVVLVALMARIPPLERGIGADKLARWHSMGGRYTVSLVAAHAVLITWGYAVTAHTNVISQTSTLLLSYPDVLMATVAGALLIGVGAVSARAARRRMRYETWYYLHFYTYLAVALAFSHQFADGAEFMTDRSARVLWAALYTAVGAAILWYRFVTPVRQAIRHRLRVESVVTEASGVVSLVITGRRVDELGAEPGQFLRWRFLTRDLWWTSLPYSLSAPVAGGRLRITVRVQGDHSRALADVRPGTRVLSEGPYGALTAAVGRRPKVLLVAGGVGITPLHALFQTLVADADVVLVYRAGSPDDVVFRDELDAVSRRHGATVRLVVGHRSELGGDPLSAAAFRANVPDLVERDAYVCGPPGMSAAVSASLRAAGVPGRQIHHESFEF